MKKLLGKRLACMVGAACGTLLAANAHAINLDTGAGALPYGAEITNPADLIEGLNADQQVVAKTGWSFPDGDTAYIRFDLNNAATFRAQVLAAAYAINDDSAGAATVNIAGGGAAGSTYVVFAVSPSALTESIVDGVDGTFDIAATGIHVLDGNPVTVTQRVYADAAAASQGTTEYVTIKNGNLVTRPAIIVTANTGTTPEVIDVSQGSLFFVTANGDDVTSIGAIQIDESATTLIANGTLANTTDPLDPVTAASTFVVSGNFDAADAVWLQANICDASANRVLGTSVATTFAGNQATITTGNVALPLNTQVCMSVDGVTQIEAGSYTGSWYPVSAAGYTVTSPQAFGTLSTLVKNATTDDLYFSVNPRSPWLQYVRFTNPSGTDGKIYITLYKDDGSNSQIMLTELGEASDILTGQASSRQFKLTDMYNAAFADGATYEGKVRVMVEGEFGTANARTQVQVQGILVSKDADGDVFQMFHK